MDVVSDGRLITGLGVGDIVLSLRAPYLRGIARRLVEEIVVPVRDGAR